MHWLSIGRKKRSRISEIMATASDPNQPGADKREPHLKLPPLHELNLQVNRILERVPAD